MFAAVLAFPVIGPFIAFVVQVLQVLARIANAIPGAVWALVLLVAMFFWWSAAGDRDDALADLGKAKEEVAALRKAITDQKAEAARILALETAKTEKINTDLREARATLEKASANRIAESKAAEKRLAVAIADAGGQLRDPNATGCGESGDSPETEVATTAHDRGEDVAETGRLLSEPLTRLLQKLTSEAGEINDAYATCRQDSIDLRALLAPSP